MPGNHRETSHTHRKLPNLHGGSLGSLGRGRLISARHPVSGLFRWITGKAGYFSQRGRTADPDGSPCPTLAGATPIQTGFPAATARPLTPIGSCRICTAGALAASAGDRSSAPGGPFSLVPRHNRPFLSARAGGPSRQLCVPSPFGASLCRAGWSGGAAGLRQGRPRLRSGPTPYEASYHFVHITVSA